MSTHNICFFLRNKKNLPIFWLKKKRLIKSYDTLKCFFFCFLYKDPPADPMDYLVQASISDESNQLPNQVASENSFLLDSQLSIPSSHSAGTDEHEDLSLATSQKLTNKDKHIIIEDEPSLVSASRSESEQISVITVKDESASVITVENEASFTPSSQHQPHSSHSAQVLKPSVSSISDLCTPSVPGPSGAASQTYTPDICSNLDTFLVQHPHVTQSTPVVKNVIPSTSSTTISSSPILPIGSTKNLSSSSLACKPLFFNSESNCNLSKARDQSKVKRSKENSALNDEKLSQTGRKTDECLNEVNSEMHENATTVQLFSSTDNCRKDKPLQRVSERLQTQMSEPVWKDLIPKKKSPSIENFELKRDTNSLLEERVVEVKTSETACGHSLNIKPVLMAADSNNNQNCRIIENDDNFSYQKSDTKEKLIINNNGIEMNKADVKDDQKEVLKESTFTERRKPEILLSSGTGMEYNYAILEKNRAQLFKTNDVIS